MDATLSKLADFVKRPDTHLACAAAVVLAELAPRDGDVTDALISALGKADAARRPFIIEALGRIGTPQAAEALMPLIQAGGPSSDDALRAVAHAGAGALKPLVGLLANASDAMRPKLAEAIGRTGETQGFAALLSAMQGALDPVVFSLTAGLRNAVGGLNEKGREHLGAQLAKALERTGFVKQVSCCVSACELLGLVASPDAATTLLGLSKEGHPLPVRRASLRALGRLNMTPAQKGRLFTRLLPLLEDADFTHVAEPAMEALRGAESGAEHRVALQKLMSSQYPRVREFAMQALAKVGSARGLRELLACLDNPDPTIVEDALQALGQNADAAEPLTERLIECKEGPSCRALARALAANAKSIPEQLLAKLAQEYIALAVGKGLAGPAGDERRGALLSVLRAANTPVLAGTALKEARKQRDAGDALRALALLKSIANINGWTDEHRLELAVSGLSAAPLDLTRSARANDSRLRLIEEILGRTEPKALAKTLAKDGSLARAALYYLGHHFSEQMLRERDFGRLILEALAENPRNDEGRQAREKLVLEGLAKSAGKAKAGLLEERSKALFAAEELAVKAEVEAALKEKQRDAKEKRAKAAEKAKAKATANAAEKAVAKLTAKSAKAKKKGGRK
jgi:HEAT repeat protein